MMFSLKMCACLYCPFKISVPVRLLLKIVFSLYKKWGMLILSYSNQRSCPSVTKNGVSTVYYYYYYFFKKYVNILMLKSAFLSVA